MTSRGIEQGVNPEKFDVFKRLRELGVQTELFGERVEFRLNLRFDHTNVIEDEIRAIRFAKLISKEQSPRSANFLTPKQLRDLITATVLTDIGKTGPLVATEEQSLIVTKFFAVDGFFPPSGSIEGFAKKFLSDPKAAVEILAELGIPPKTIVRELWDAHVRWTGELLATSQLSKEVQLSASLHHLLETPNPFEFVGPDGCFLGPEIRRPIDQREILIILLDKFDARLRRGKNKHREAVDWLRNYIEKNENLKKFSPWVKEKFLLCLDDLDMVLKPKRVIVLRSSQQTKSPIL